MDTSKPTLAIYGIQDRINTDTPFYVHDHALTLMDKGSVIKHITLERLSRLKHDNKLHEQIYDVLKSEGLLKSMDYDLVFVDNVVGRTFLSSCGRFRFEAPLNDVLHSYPEKGKCWWLDREKEAYALNHELAHIGANLPFYRSFNENSLLVHFDGGGSLSNLSAWKYKSGKITSIEYHWDLQYLSGLFNANALVFGIIGSKYIDQNSVPGKMMGLAAFGSYQPEMEEWLVKNDFFKDIWHSKKSFFDAAKTDFDYDKTQLNTKDPFLHNIVATMQFIFQRELQNKLQLLSQKESLDYLYYSGGSALNIVANTQLVDSGLFKDVFIPPCPEDSGLSLGAAAYIEWLKHGSVEQHSPYINNWTIEDYLVKIEPAEIQKCANELLKGSVIAVCNNSGEIGPRALGNRSMLSLANSKALAQKVSMTHKKREWYRPVAPIMLAHNATYFTGQDKIHSLADYMLLDFKILPEKQKELQGAVHVDGTARIQVVRSKEDNPFMFELLQLLDTKYGVKALINTSFNIKGEPIVHTIEGAVESAKNMNLDGVVLNGIFQLL
nr:carbamoyltransferase C-terminal domain-containing protein [uncultured Carboxylicivirga sp.]